MPWQTVTATAGGGAIKVVMTGDQKCQSVEISPDFIKDADAEMLQDMVLSAVNMALDQSRELQAEVDGSAGGWVAVLIIYVGAQRRPIVILALNRPAVALYNV
ncbi:MAG: YbaB/EbfC family nucleoid-associated protein [Ignavibacteriales bacterium]|nr:YbaB/EbfC family nucleoid-associated protein [Ignavibacteriales bacterium]